MNTDEIIAWVKLTIADLIKICFFILLIAKLLFLTIVNSLDDYY